MATIEELKKKQEDLKKKIAQLEQAERDAAQKYETKRAAEFLKRMKEAGLFELSDEALIGLIEYTSSGVKTVPDYIARLEAGGVGKGELVKKKQRASQKPRKALADSETYTTQEKTLERPVCPTCGKDMQRRARRDGSGEFWGCTGFPECRGVISI